MFGVASAQTEKGRWRRRRVKGVVPCSPAEWMYGLLKGEKKKKTREGGCIRELHPGPFHPRLAAALTVTPLFLPPSLRLLFLPLHTPFDPWGSTQPLTHINYTLLQLPLAQASGWHGIHTPPLSISCISPPPPPPSLFCLYSCKNAP